MVTGGNGFIGSATIQSMLSKGIYSPVATVRKYSDNAIFNCQVIEIDDLQNQTDWKKNLENIDVIIHTAARVHMMSDQAMDPLIEYRRVNVDGTLNLAQQAADAGVSRFIFLSSIKVNGEATFPDNPFKPEDIPKPLDPYGITKLEAERGLFDIADQSGMEVVCVRPTLVYGPGAKGNFASLLQVVKRGIPLPLGNATKNLRSLIALGNLVDLLIKCIEHPKAGNQIFLVSDGEDVSTAELILRIGKALNQPAFLIKIPLPILKFAAKIFGKTKEAQRLLTSLQVDISKTCKVLDWSPPLSLDEGLDLASNQRIQDI